MKLFILIIILLFWPVVSDAETINGHEVEWEDATNYTISLDNPSISLGDYVINATDFDWNGSVEISVTFDGESQSTILSQGENFILDFTKNATYFRGIKIYANTVSKYPPLPVNIGTYRCCPAAEISVATPQRTTRKEPVLGLNISQSWDGRSGSAFPISIAVTNTGDADFSSGNITINLDGLQIADEQGLSDFTLSYNQTKGTITCDRSTPLLANNSYYLNLSIKPPFPPDPNKSIFNVTAESYFKDFNNNIYEANASSILSLNQAININKSITESTIIGDRDIVDDIDDSPIPNSTGELTVVYIYIENMQSYPLKSVTLTDTIMKDFALINNTLYPTKDFRIINNTTLQWVFDLNSGEEKEFKYGMKAQKPGSFVSPAAVVHWDEMGVSKTAFSDSSATRAYGAFVVLTKTTNKANLDLNESFNVTLRLEDTGDFPVRINVTDILPENVRFISGNKTFSGYLYPTKSTSLTYILSPNHYGELYFPSPVLTFWIKDNDGLFTIVSARNITVRPHQARLDTATTFWKPTPSQTPTPTQAPLPKSLIEIIGEKAPWLEGAIPIIMLFFGIILVRMLRAVKDHEI